MHIGHYLTEQSAKPKTIANRNFHSYDTIIMPIKRLGMGPNFELAFYAVVMVLSCLFIWVVISPDNHKMSFLHNFMRIVLLQWISYSKIPSGYFAALLQGFVSEFWLTHASRRNGIYIDRFANLSLSSSLLTSNFSHS